jgi:hypothetical protein
MVIFGIRGLRLFLGTAVSAALVVSACAKENKPPSDDDAVAGAGGSAGASGSAGKGGSSGGLAGSSGASGSGTGGSAGSTGGGSAGTSGNDAGGEGGMGTVDPPDSCSGDADCQPAGMVCDPVPAVCVDCLFDLDCDTGQKCVDRGCVQVTTCNNSLDCVDGAEPVCDASVAECVECVTLDDCDANNDCTDNRCVPYDRCRNSLDCSDQQVCDATRQRCVECDADADCGTDRRCVDYTCRKGCASDISCTSLGMLCNLNGGYCVECQVDLDCPSVYYCSAGSCVLDECAAGSSECIGNAVSTCRASGNGFDSVNCLSRQTCVENGTEASCTDWTCTAGVTECDAMNRRLITCSVDGLTVEDEVDCEASGEICVAGSCQDLECVPSVNFCDGETVRHCADDGLSSTLVTTCLSNQFCDDTNVSCLTQLCAPGQPWCNGQLAQVCNARGSGSTGPGTNCSGTPGMECVGGTCVCQANRRDCDGESSTGCEVNTSNDEDNCGSCDAVCSSSHVPTPTCSASTCNGTCQSGYMDCNADKRTDGCEIHTDADATNCGACGRSCSALNIASPTCGTGICNGNCTSGYADCNSNKQTDGCETETQANPNACGGCANSCSANHMQTRTCGSGTCNGTCAAGYADCNTNKLTDGCETDVRYDEQNCGACGDPCSNGESCVGGVCQVCNDTVLFLSDASTAPNTALQTALQNAGLVITFQSGGVRDYAGTPVASDFGAVIALVGNYYGTNMQAAGQTAIVAAQAAGTGVVFTEGAAYTRYNYPAYWTTLDPLLLLTYSTTSSAVMNLTLTAAGHPIWDTLPTTFTGSVSMLRTVATVKNGGTSIASCVSCGTAGGVVVKDSGGGRIVHHAHWANYTSTWTGDANVMKVFVNSVKWATGCF